MKILLKCALILLMATAIPLSAQAQVAQWNQVVADKDLEQAFHRAVREVSVDFINKMETDGIPAVISFVDTQFDYPLQLTTANFRHIQLNAAQNKLIYLLHYQAKTTRGVQVSIASKRPPNGLGLAVVNMLEPTASYSGGGQIPGDGAMMLCPVNRNGLEFMYGGLSVATLNANGEFRSKEDGATIIQLHDKILKLTYSHYGHTPQ